MKGGREEGKGGGGPNNIPNILKSENKYKVFKKIQRRKKKVERRKKKEERRKKKEERRKKNPGIMTHELPYHLSLL